MSKETTTHCDGCNTRVYSGEEDMLSLPVGEMIEESKRPAAKYDRICKGLDVCNDCREMLVRYLTGLMVYGTVVAVSFDRSQMVQTDRCKDGDLIAFLICGASIDHPDKVHAILSAVFRYGGVTDWVDPEGEKASA